MLEAYQKLEGGLGSYNVVRVWEVRLMERLKIVDEDEYVNIPIKVRARMIAARIGPKMVQSLEQHRVYEKIRKESKAK